ncbi:MAG: YdcH family protein [Alphaproteobacteria bacterium]|nr:YdcH family protein [Alphaproteobacteria bacterium]
MTQATHVESLKAKHAELEAMIEQENNRPLPDEMTITQLKRQKLRIKDELASLGE